MSCLPPRIHVRVLSPSSHTRCYILVCLGIEVVGDRGGELSCFWLSSWRICCVQATRLCTVCSTGYWCCCRCLPTAHQHQPCTSLPALTATHPRHILPVPAHILVHPSPWGTVDQVHCWGAPGSARGGRQLRCEGETHASGEPREQITRQLRARARAQEASRTGPERAVALWCQNDCANN